MQSVARSSDPSSRFWTSPHAKEAYRGQGIGSRLLRLVEQQARLFGYHRFLLGAQPEAQSFYLKNGYTPLLWLHVEDSGVDQLEQLL